MDDLARSAYLSFAVKDKVIVTSDRRQLESLLDSGGRIEDIKSTVEIEPAFREILAELREQYVLGYYPSNATGDGRWHEVKVRARGTGRVRVRGGYVDR